MGEICSTSPDSVSLDSMRLFEAGEGLLEVATEVEGLVGDWLPLELVLYAGGAEREVIST